MDGLIEGFEWVIRFFKALYAVLDHFFSSLYNSLKFLASAYDFIIGTFSSLPSFLIPFATITVAWCLMCFIVGRSHS